MDERTLQYAQDLMREYRVCEAIPVPMMTKLRRLKKSLFRAVSRFIKDEPQTPVQNGGVFTRIGGFLLRGLRNALRWMTKKVILPAGMQLKR